MVKMTKTPTLLSILAFELVLIELYIPALIVVAIATLLDNFNESENIYDKFTVDCEEITNE